jgi:hypothetical protein
MIRDAEDIGFLRRFSSVLLVRVRTRIRRNLVASDDRPRHQSLGRHLLHRRRSARRCGVVLLETRPAICRNR